MNPRINTSHCAMPADPVPRNGVPRNTTPPVESTSLSYLARFRNALTSACQAELISVSKRCRRQDQRVHQRKRRSDLGDNNASEAGPNKDKPSLPNTLLLVSLQYFQKGVAKCQNVYFLGIVGVAVGVVVICPNTGLRQHLRQHVFIAEPVRASAPWFLISLVERPSPRRLCFDSVHCNDATIVLAYSFFSCGCKQWLTRWSCCGYCCPSGRAA